MAVRIRLKRIGHIKLLSTVWWFPIPVLRVMVVLSKKSVLITQLLNQQLWFLMRRKHLNGFKLALNRPIPFAACSQSRFDD